MKDHHEINRLLIDVKGDFDIEVERIFRKIVPEVVEHCFDQFGVGEKTIVIDKIVFNLGHIKRQHLEEEVRVRLTYLINTEVLKFLNQPNLDELIDERTKLSGSEAFIQYLQFGFTNGDETDLSKLFEQLLHADFQLLIEIIDQSKFSNEAWNRLFFQVKYENQEAYWSKLHPFVYTQVKKINTRILEDFGAVLSLDQNISGIQGVLKRHTFDFMMRVQPFERTKGAYMALLKANYNSFTRFQDAIKQSAFQYFEELETILNTNKGDELSTSVFELLKDSLAYIQKGEYKKPSGDRSIYDLMRTLTSEQVRGLAKSMVFSSKSRTLQSQLQRLVKTLSIIHLELFFDTLKIVGGQRIAAGIQTFIYLRSVINQSFQEDIFEFTSSVISTYLSRELLKAGSGREIDQIVEQVSARKRFSDQEVIVLLIKQLEGAKHHEAAVLKKQLIEIQSGKGHTQASFNDTKNVMGAYIHYLKTGVWVLLDTTPALVLEKLLKDSHEHLNQELTKNLNQQVLWLRLVYQQPIDLLIEVFKLVFSGDIGLDYILKEVERAEEMGHSMLIQRKILEAYVVVKSEFEINAQTNVEVELVQKISRYLSADESESISDGNIAIRSEERIVSLLQTILDRGERTEMDHVTQNRIVIHVINHPHLITGYLRQDDISIKKWLHLLGLVEKSQLVDLIRAIGRHISIGQWTSTFIQVLQKEDFTVITDSKSLIQVLLLVSGNQEEQLKELVRKIWVRYGNRNSEQAATLLLQPLIGDFVTQTVASPSVVTLSNKGISEKEIGKIENQLGIGFKLIRDKASGVLYKDVLSQLNDLLPMSTSKAKVKVHLLYELYLAHPAHLDILHIFSKSILENIDEIEVLYFVVSNYQETGVFQLAPFFTKQEDFEKGLVSLLKKDEKEFLAITAILSIAQLATLLGALSHKAVKVIHKIIGVGETDFLVIAEHLHKRYKGFVDLTKITENKRVTIDKPLMSVSALVEQLISLDSVEVAPYFKSFQDFERQLLILIKAEGKILATLSNTDIPHLIRFLTQLSDDTLRTLEKIIETKFGQTSYQYILQSIKEVNAGQVRQIEILAISYGFTNRTFQISNLSKFINGYLTDHTWSIVDLPESEEAFQEEPGEHYVRAFLHFIKYQTYIYLPLEQDGLVMALDKITTYWLDNLLHHLTNEPEVKKVMSGILESVPENKQEAFFRRIVTVDRVSLDHVYQELLQISGVHKKDIWVSWLVIQLQQNITTGTLEVIALIKNEYAPELSQKRRVLSDPTKELELIDVSKASMDELPTEFLKLGIAKMKTSDFNVFDLIVEVIKTGKYPSWSSINSTSQYADLVMTVWRITPRTLQPILNKRLRVFGHLEKFVHGLGHSNFLVLFKKMEPRLSSSMSSTVTDLVRAHADLGNKDALKMYFEMKYVAIRYILNTDVIEPIIFKLLQAVPDDFGMSMSDYQVLLETSAQPILLKYSQGIQAHREIDAVLPDQQYEIDLLLHLVLENKKPWWALTNLMFNALSVKESIEKLTIQLLDKNPELVLGAISKSGRSDMIYQRIMPLVTNTHFDRLLLMLMPDFGGFIISFNMLLFRWKKTQDRSRWFMFLLKHLNGKSTVDVKSFVGQAMLNVSKEFETDLNTARKALLDGAKKAISGGEMRFLPFVDILGNIEIEFEKPIKAQLDTRSFPMDWQTTVVHYIRTGALPLGSMSGVNSYFDFSERIERQLRLGHNELRLAIINVLSYQEVRARLVKYEKEHFLWLLVKVLYPQEKNRLLTYNEGVIKLFNTKWPIIQITLVQELFFQTLFEQVLTTNFINLSAAELVTIFMNKTKEVFDLEFVWEGDELAQYGLSDLLLADMIVSTGSKVKQKDKRKTKKALAKQHFPKNKEAIVDHRTLVKNAGVVIFWPYFSRYFEMLGMLEEGAFKSPADSVRAVQLLYYMSTGLIAVPEHELLLCKVLCGVKISTPVPLELSLSEQEKETTEMMLKGVLQNWEKLKDSSIEALREGFLVRDGYIIEKEKIWELKVEKKTLDILMENLPWAFGTVKLPWMEKRLIVEWL